MASYADAAKQHTIFRDCSDQLSGVKPIFILESDVLSKPKADFGPNFFFEGIPGISCVKVYRFVSKHQGR
jgi:hypothetical protein